jgi:hypothetical protein
VPVAGIEFFDDGAVEIGGLGVKVTFWGLETSNDGEVFEGSGDTDDKIDANKHKDEIIGDGLEGGEWMWEVFEREE